jgi:hypothetical protein
VHQDLAIAQIGNVGLDDFKVAGLGNIGRPGFQNDLTIAIVLHEPKVPAGIKDAGDEMGCRVYELDEAMTKPLKWRVRR